DQPLAAERLAIGREHRAAVFFDRPLKFFHFLRRGRSDQVRGAESDGFAGELAPLARRAGLFPGFSLRHDDAARTVCLPHGGSFFQAPQRGGNSATTIAGMAITAPPNSAMPPALMPPTGMAVKVRQDFCAGGCYF